MPGRRCHHPHTFASEETGGFYLCCACGRRPEGEPRAVVIIPVIVDGVWMGATLGRSEDWIEGETCPGCGRTR